MSIQTPPAPTFDEAAAFVLPFDKFQGQTLAQAHAADPAYVRWLAKQMVPRNDLGRTIKAMATAYLAGLNQPQKSNGHPRPNGHKPVQKQSPVPAPPADAEKKSHPRIYTQITRSAILHIEDALAIGKVRLFMISYQRGQGAKATAVHYLDVEDARVLAFDLAVRGALAEKFTDFKGSPTGLNGKPLSRVFKLEDRGQGQRAPIVFQVSQGPGEVVGEGAIKPAGKPTVEIAMLLTRWQARRLGHALQAYLQAWDTAQMMTNAHG
jgi:uncharacterized protein (DUF3820 family)